MFGDNNDNNSFGTNYNFYNPSFLQGICSSINISGNHYSNNLHSDSLSLRNDWGTIGNDFHDSFNKFNSNYNPYKSDNSFNF